jgi:hypothetical protein
MKRRLVFTTLGPITLSLLFAAYSVPAHAAAMLQWGREPNFGLIVVPDPATNAHRKLINELAMRHRLPVIHAYCDRQRYMPIASSRVPTPLTSQSPCRLSLSW